MSTLFLLFFTLLGSALFFDPQTDCGVERNQQVYVPTDQNFDCYISEASVPFLINICSYNPACDDLRTQLFRLAKEYDGRLKVSISYEHSSLKLLRRLSVPLFPTLFFSQDGKSFLDYYWPRQYQDLVALVTENYKKYPTDRWRPLDPESLHVYLQESFWYWVEIAGNKVEGLLSAVGLGWTSAVVKVALAIAIIGGVVLLVLLELYECFKEQRKISTIWKKKII